MQTAFNYKCQLTAKERKNTQNEQKIASWISQKGNSKFKLKLRIFLLLICKPLRRVVGIVDAVGELKQRSIHFIWAERTRCHGNIMGRKKECKVPASQKKIKEGLHKKKYFQIKTLTRNPRQIRHANNLLIFTHNSLTLEHELNLIIIENHLKIALSSSAA